MVIIKCKVCTSKFPGHPDLHLTDGYKSNRTEVIYYLCTRDLYPLGTRRCCNVESTSMTLIQRCNNSCAQWDTLPMVQGRMLLISISMFKKFKVGGGWLNCTNNNDILMIVAILFFCYYLLSAAFITIQVIYLFTRPY